MWQRSRFVDKPEYRGRSEGWKADMQEIERCTIRGAGIVGTPKCNVVLSCHKGTSEDILERVVQCVNALEGVKSPEVVQELLSALRLKDKEKLKRCLNSVEFEETHGNERTDSPNNMGAPLLRVDGLLVPGMGQDSRPKSSKASNTRRTKRQMSNKS